MSGRQWASVLAIVFIALGGVALAWAPGAGLAAADAWLRGVGGAADAGRYEIVARAYVDAYLVAGGILLFAGTLLAVDLARRSVGRTEAERRQP